MEELHVEYARISVYLTQYRAAGVKFNFVKTVKASKRPEDQEGLSERDKARETFEVPNDEVELETVEKFVDCRYNSEKAMFTYEDFLIRELVYLEGFRQSVRDCKFRLN